MVGSTAACVASLVLAHYLATTTQMRPEKVDATRKATNWFLGKTGESCHTVCGKEGKHCTLASVSEQNSLERADLVTKMQEQGIECNIQVFPNPSSVTPYKHSDGRCAYIAKWGSQRSTCDAEHAKVRRFCSCKDVVMPVEMRGRWRDRTDSFYDGAVIVIMERDWSVENAQGIWKDAEFRLEKTDAGWDLVESRSGSKHHHIIQLKSSGFISVRNGEWKLTKEPGQFHEVPSSNECGEGHSKLGLEECKKYAKGPYLGEVKEVNYGKYPRGCMSLSQAILFNDAFPGKAHSDAQLICKSEAQGDGGQAHVEAQEQPFGGEAWHHQPQLLLVAALALAFARA